MTIIDNSILIPPAILAGLAVYLVPFVIALIRKAEHRTGILWINLLLGWTILGWLAALIWAVLETKASAGKGAHANVKQASIPDFVEGKAQEKRRPERVQPAKDQWVLE